MLIFLARSPLAEGYIRGRLLVSGIEEKRRSCTFNNNEICCDVLLSLMRGFNGVDSIAVVSYLSVGKLIR